MPAGAAVRAGDSGRGGEGGAVGRVQWSVYARWVEAAGGLGSLALGKGLADGTTDQDQTDIWVLDSIAGGTNVSLDLVTI